MGRCSLAPVVSFTRIDSFLNEGEVPDEVSSLKRSAAGPLEQYDTRLGAEAAFFKWNENEKKKDADADGSDAGTPEGRPVFQLCDITVTFPEGKLTMVTGPTASGKTACVLVSCVSAS